MESTMLIIISGALLITSLVVFFITYRKSYSMDEQTPLTSPGPEIILDIPEINQSQEEEQELIHEEVEQIKPEQCEINQLYDLNNYFTFEEVKDILEENNKQFNEEVSKKNKVLMELTSQFGAKNEETFLLEIPKLQLENIKKFNEIITTEDDSLLELNSVERNKELLEDEEVDDLEDLLGTPLKLRTSVEELVKLDGEMTCAEMRMLIMKELLETERSYVQCMVILNEKYVVPSKKFLSQSAINSIFGDVDMIIGVNQKFLEKLEKLESMESQDEKELELIKIFKSYFLTFKLYVRYISNYNQAQKSLRNAILKNLKYHAFLQEVRTDLISKKYRMQTLNSYLISPVQRLPRYEMLTKDLLKNTPKESKLYQEFAESLQLIQQVTSYCNEKQGEIETNLRLSYLKKYLKMKVIQ